MLIVVMSQSSQDASHVSKFYWPRWLLCWCELKDCSPRADRQTSASQFGLSTNWSSWWHVRFPFWLPGETHWEITQHSIGAVLWMWISCAQRSASSTVFYSTCDLLLPSVIKFNWLTMKHHSNKHLLVWILLNFQNVSVHLWVSSQHTSISFRPRT